jgi:hypothetical protein
MRTDDASVAGTPGVKDARKQLEQDPKEIYGDDECVTKLADMTVNTASKDEPLGVLTLQREYPARTG